MLRDPMAMGESWYYLEHGRCAPAWNMACDFWLLQHAREIGRPLLRTYAWDRPSVTIGYFQAWPSELIPRYSVVRRPTGGALVYHDADLTFTVVLPPDHPWCGLRAAERYRRVHERIVGLFRKRGVAAALTATEPPESRSRKAACFEKKSRHDVLVDRVKVAGGAQRVTKDGLLHQGSIQIARQSAPSARELVAAWEAGGMEFERLALTDRQTAEIDRLVEESFGTRRWNEDGGRKV